MTDADRKRLEEIREREQAATQPDEWVADVAAGDSGKRLHPGNPINLNTLSVWVVLHGCRSRRQALSDAEFAAHSRSDIPWLLDQLDAANTRAAQMLRRFCADEMQPINHEQGCNCGCCVESRLAMKLADEIEKGGGT